MDDGRVMVGRRLAACVLILASGCSGSAPTQAPSSAPPPSVSPGPSVGTPVASAIPGPTTCALTPIPHQAPEIEAVLPATVEGRPLSRWSVRGRCWLEIAFDSPTAIDAFVAKFTTPTNPNPIDGTNLVYGIAGRSDTKTDPPYFVFAAVRPSNDDETRLARSLLFGGGSIRDLYAMDLTNYETQSIAGKQVYVGTLSMLNQTDHQRGRPFFYQNDRYMFLVISDKDEWAAEAIGQLP